MIYQIFHKPELLDVCDTASTGNRPMAVGPAALACRQPGILTDAEGTDQISALNLQLNEWTGIYWLWRHLPELTDSDAWIGVSHYRRPAPAFMRTDGAIVDRLLRDYDLLAWIPNISALEQQAAPANPGLFATIWTTVEAVFDRPLRERLTAMSAVPMIHPFSNCFVMTKPRFADYAAWSWRLLEPLVVAAHRAQRVDPAFALDAPRNLGFLSERLLPLYCMAHGLKIGFSFTGQYPAHGRD